MVQPSKSAFSITSISIKTTIERVEKSAQQRVHWPLQDDVFFKSNKQEIVKRPIMKQAFPNAWNALKRYFRCWSRCQELRLRSQFFWSSWSFTRATHCKKKRSKRISLHQEIVLKHFVISAMKRFRAETFRFKLKRFVSNRVAVTWFEHKELTIW